jgi:hypothetical protein
VSVHDGSGSARDDLVVTRLRRLASSLDGEPDPEFRAATRARLVAMAAVRTPVTAPASRLWGLLAGRAPDASSLRWRARLTAGLAGAALTVTTLATLVAVADGTGPGDVLYDLKRGTERTQLALAGDSRGQILLDFASTRLDELEVLVGDGASALPAAMPAGPGDAAVSATGADPVLVLETLQAMDAETGEGTVWLTDRAVESSDAGPLDHLAQWAAGQADDLVALQDLVPDAAAEAVGRSLTLLADVGARADGLQAALGCPAGPAVDGTDDLGPVPVPCPPPAPGPPPAGGSGGTSTRTSTVDGGAPVATDPTVPTPAPTGGRGPGGTVPAPPTPVVPSPTTSVPGGLLPPLSTTAPQRPSTPTVQLPPVGPVTVCVPPLAIGHC